MGSTRSSVHRDPSPALEDPPLETALEGPRHPMSTSELLRTREAAPSTGGLSLRMMTVHAHPDDESSKGAATCARYVDEGARSPSSPVPAASAAAS